MNLSRMKSRKGWLSWPLRTVLSIPNRQEVVSLGVDWDPEHPGGTTESVEEVSHIARLVAAAPGLAERLAEAEELVREALSKERESSVLYELGHEWRTRAEALFAESRLHRPMKDEDARPEATLTDIAEKQKEGNP